MALKVIYQRSEPDHHFQENNDEVQDIVLWQRFRNGEKDAFSHIYKLFFSTLYNYGRQFCADSSQVKDCIQDLFVELWQKRSRLGETDSIKFYLYKCLRRKILKRLSGKRLISFSAEELPLSAFPVALSVEGEMIAKTEQRAQIKKLRDAVNALSPQQREVIFLLFFEELSQGQVASVLAIESKTVRNLLWKALKTLRTILTSPLLAILFLFGHPTAPASEVTLF